MPNLASVSPFRQRLPAPGCLRQHQETTFKTSPSRIHFDSSTGTGTGTGEPHGPGPLSFPGFYSAHLLWRWSSLWQSCFLDPFLYGEPSAHATTLFPLPYHTSCQQVCHGEPSAHAAPVVSHSIYHTSANSHAMHGEPLAHAILVSVGSTEGYTRAPTTSCVLAWCCILH